MTMRVTLHDIARAAGVSSATVDRVLNNRDGVRARTREIVVDAARRLGYLPESEGGLATAPPVRTRFVLPAGTNSFMLSLAQQLTDQANLRGDVISGIDMIEGFNPERLAAFLHDLDDQTEGVGLVALDHPAVREAIRELAQRRKKVVTLISDIHNVPRAAYVGIDNRQAGRLAGYLIGRLLRGHRRAKIAFFAGSRAYRGHEEREMGFRHVLAEDFPDIEVVAHREMRDDRERAYAEALAVLDSFPELVGIYNAGAGTAGIARALVDRGRSRDVVVIAHEAIDENKRALLDGTIDAVIDQNPRVEAREALNALVSAVRDEPYRVIAPRLLAVFRENLPDD